MRLPLAVTGDADDLADLLFDDDAQILRREQFGRAQVRKQDGGAHGRMAGEGQFARRA